MPITSSAKKALRQSKKRRQNNITKKVKIKILKKEILKADKKDTKNLSALYKAIDKAAKRKVIHKNKAARLKSRISKRIGK